MRAGVEGGSVCRLRMAKCRMTNVGAILRERVAKKDQREGVFHPNVGSSAFRRGWTIRCCAKQFRRADPGALGRAIGGNHTESVERARANIRQLGVTNALKLRAAGIKVVLGSDTGQTRFFIGWMGQLEFENWVWMGLTPMEAIVAATRDSAEAVHFNTGLIAPRQKRRLHGAGCESAGKHCQLAGRSAECSFAGGKLTGPHCGPSGQARWPRGRR